MLSFMCVEHFLKLRGVLRDGATDLGTNGMHVAVRTIKMDTVTQVEP